MYGIAILAILSVYPALNIRTDFNLEGFYPDDDIVIEDYRLLEEEFGRDDNTIIIGFQTDTLFSRSVLFDIKTLTDELDSLSIISETLSIWNATDISSDGFNLDFNPYLQD